MNMIEMYGILCKPQKLRGGIQINNMQIDYRIKIKFSIIDKRISQKSNPGSFANLRFF